MRDQGRKDQGASPGVFIRGRWENQPGSRSEGGMDKERLETGGGGSYRQGAGSRGRWPEPGWRAVTTVNISVKNMTGQTGCGQLDVTGRVKELTFSRGLTCVTG